MADLQCSPRGSLAPLKYLFDITRECELIHRSKPKQAKKRAIIFYACANTPNRLQRRGRNSALPRCHSTLAANIQAPQKNQASESSLWSGMRKRDAGIIQ